ncbi:hypothetical protein ACLOJK_027621 [Asimina triloba]
MPATTSVDGNDNEQWRTTKMTFGKKFPENNQEMEKVPGTFGDGRAARSRARRATTNVVKLDLMTKRVAESRDLMMASYGGAAMMSVQELSREGAGPPQPFIWRKNQERPIDASPPTSPIPAIDLELLFSSDGDSRMGEMEKLLSALKSWGLFQVMGGGRIVKDEIKHPRQAAVEAEHMGVEQLAVGHGIPTSLIDDVGKVSREYFDLPKEEKEKFSKAVYKEGDEKDEIASEDEIRDWCDHLYLLVLPEDERDMSLWPENPCKLRY